MATNSRPVKMIVLRCSPSWPRTGSLQVLPSLLVRRRACKPTPTKTPLPKATSTRVSMGLVSGASVHTLESGDEADPSAVAHADPHFVAKRHAAEHVFAVDREIFVPRDAIRRKRHEGLGDSDRPGIAAASARKVPFSKGEAAKVVLVLSVTLAQFPFRTVWAGGHDIVAAERADGDEVAVAEGGGAEDLALFAEFRSSPRLAVFGGDAEPVVAGQAGRKLWDPIQVRRGRGQPKKF